MTLAHEAPARQDTCRAVRPACDPTTLGAVCAGDCGRRLHDRAWNGPKRACDGGHPVRDGHGLCAGCAQARRRATPEETIALTWQGQAACRGVNPALFFPDIPAGANFTRIVAPVAARYCARCPVAAACDRYAEATKSLGLWAGVWRRYRGSSYTRTPVIPRREAS